MEASQVSRSPMSEEKKGYVLLEPCWEISEIGTGRTTPKEASSLLKASLRTYMN